MPPFPYYEQGLMDDVEFRMTKKARDAGAGRLEISFMTVGELDRYNKATTEQLAKAKQTMSAAVGPGVPQARLDALV